MVAPEPSEGAGVPWPVGDAASVGVALGWSVNPPELGEIDPTTLGPSVASAAGSREVNGDPAPWLCGAALPGPPSGASDCGPSRVELVPAPGWTMWSLLTGSGSNTTPA